jgi:hypothetical protein
LLIETSFLKNKLCKAFEDKEIQSAEYRVERLILHFYTLIKESIPSSKVYRPATKSTS